MAVPVWHGRRGRVTLAPRLAPNWLAPAIDGNSRVALVSMPSMNDLPESEERDGGSPPASATSRSLLAGVQADEPDAWERLVTLYAPLVLHWCRGSGLQGQDTADIFQEVFRAVVVSVGSF